MANNLDPTLDERSETSALARMRLALVLVALLGLFIDVPGQSRLEQCMPLAMGAYITVSIGLFLLCERGPHMLTGLRWHWLDLPLYAGLVACSGGAHSVYYLFFYFAILSASFHWGWREGVRVTLGAVLFFVGVGLAFVQRAHDASALLGRAGLLLVLGLMIAYWGESKLELRRRLALQRRVSNIANPRFGAGQTVQGLLEAIRDYYGASLCLLVLRNEDGGAVSVRLAQQGIAIRDGSAVEPTLADSLLLDLPAHLLAFKSQRHREHWRGAAHDLEQGQWHALDRETGAVIGALLGAGSFVSAPARLGRAAGRIYVAARTPRLGRNDALFLQQVTAHALPLIENIEVLDHLATDAASAERQKIAMDLHDSAVQPYIGLRFGLSALRCKADPANPLNEDLDRLIAMSNEVIGDLRSFAQGVRSCAHEAQHPLAAALRQQVRLIREFHGVDIEVELEEKDVPCSDRLAAEVLQIVREALSNIVRHTVARHALVQVRCDHGLLRIQVDNEGAANECDFTPKSITARAAALGGRAYVQRAQAGTAVHVEIPV
ncbi:MAG: histidine kinase [Proteobacteria bacterium]|nr:histidine kinase [Pseudomonadota bacterium]